MAKNNFLIKGDEAIYYKQYIYKKKRRKSG